MVNIRLPYLVEDRDRHGNFRVYFRRRGQRKIRLRGIPGSDDFLEQYRQALAGTGATPRQSRRIAKGSFSYLCKAYFASATFQALDVSTRSWRGRALEAICESHGDKPFALMEGKHIRALRDAKAEQPAASKNRLKALRALFRWAVEAGEARHDPTRDVRPIAYSSGGFHTWSLEDVEAYETCHPVGSKARLAMMLMLYTACRREDVVRLGPQLIRDGRIRFRQAKNEHRNPVDIDIPLHPDLCAAIEATPSGHLTFLVTELGKPFSANGFGNRFKDWCRQANLPHCSAHGLRKATAARLAEKGASPHEIMAITGHRSLEEVERYTRAARKVTLADAAMAKFKS